MRRRGRQLVPAETDPAIVRKALEGLIADDAALVAAADRLAAAEALVARLREKKRLLTALAALYAQEES